MPEIVRGSRSRNTGEETVLQSLNGQITIGDMGSRVQRDKPSTTRSEPVQSQQNDQEENDSFGQLFAFIQEQLPDLSHDTIHSATVTVVEIIKDGSRSDSNKKKEIEEILEPMTNAEFNNLYNLVQKVQNIDIYSENGTNGAVVDETTVNEDDEEDNEYDNVVQDEDDSDDSDDDDLIARPATKYDEQIQSDDEDADILAPHHAVQKLLPQQVTSHWLADFLKDTSVSVRDVLARLELPEDQVENALLQLFDYANLDIVRTLVLNREPVYWLTSFRRAENGPNRDAILKRMSDAGVAHLLEEKPTEATSQPEGRAPKIIDIDASLFLNRQSVLANNKFTLPEGSSRTVTRSYEQYNVPYPERNATNDQPLVEISSLPSWMQQTFGGIERLNRVQSRVANTVLRTDNNILLSAPTGAGKTNVALLAMLQTIEKYRLENGSIDLDNFKIIYISPLKALVQEQVREFGKKLAPLGISVEELSGDRSLTGDQIATVQLLITTPEKWDVVTRKSSDLSYTSLVRLVIIDEIHLLNDERGPVLENIVARTLQANNYGEKTRLVGLSATLSNYKDVAQFLQAENGTFHFDATFRPVPLNLSFLGITEKSAIKRYKAMNDACYEKILEQINTNQVIVFVHSRKDTVKTANYIVDKATEEAKDKLFNKPKPDQFESVSNLALQNLISRGIAVHHAGLGRNDRNIVEQLFADRTIKVLISTATLAWGVNLPAHAVIIKGTEIYNSQAGGWEEMSPQDVLQMLGRAGRPGFDSFGEGIVITAHKELNYYMSIMTSKFDIESHLMERLAESLNAECSLGSIRTLDQGVTWLKQTYLYVRMQRQPSLYRVGLDYDEDHQLEYHCEDLVHSSLTLLDSLGLLHYDTNEKAIKPTEMGKIAANFYISPTSMALYVEQLKPYLDSVQIFRIFARSEEFRYIPVRQEERPELARLAEITPVPIKEDSDTHLAKINTLLQAYISRLNLTGFALSADMMYVSQSASRIFRAMFEIAIARKWANLAMKLLDLFKMVDKRVWVTSSPFRQFAGVPSEIVRRTENSQLPFQRYFDLENADEVGQALRSEQHGQLVFDYLQRFPRFEVTANLQPLTPSLLRVSVEVRPLFHWDSMIHARNEAFLLIIEDSDKDTLLLTDWIRLNKFNASKTITLDYTVAVVEPHPPAYFVSVTSERWLHSRSSTVMSMNKLILPSKFIAPIKLKAANKQVDLSSLESQFPLSHAQLNDYQHMVWDTLNDTGANMFVGLANGNGKTFTAELLIAIHLNSPGKIIYITPLQEQADLQYHNWSDRVPNICKLSGDIRTDLSLLAGSKVIIGTAAQWEYLTRSWQRRKPVQQVTLLICDDVHMVGGMDGHIIELAVLRTKFMATQLELPLRVVGLGVPIADGRDFGQWLGAERQDIFNFSPQERVYPLDLRVIGFDLANQQSRSMIMSRTVLEELQQWDSSLIFIADRRQCIRMGYYLAELAKSLGHSYFEGNVKVATEFEDPGLTQMSKRGVLFIYKGMSEKDRLKVLQLQPRILLATRDACWDAPTKSLVVVLDTQYYEEREARFVDYTAGEVLQMTGLAGKKAMVLTTKLKKEYYTRFLAEPLPVESHISFFVPDSLVPEISEKVVSSSEDILDWVTYTYFFRRLRKNPSYYGLNSLDEDDLNEYLSELVETTTEELENFGIIETSEDYAFTARNESFISSIFGISVHSLQILRGLGPRSRLHEILETVCSTAEFESIPLASTDFKVLQHLGPQLPIRFSKVGDHAMLAQFKAFVLTQCYMSRIALSPDLAKDLEPVLLKVLRTVEATIDILAGEGHLNVLTAVDLHQMVTQGLWDKDSVLKQIPHVDDACVARSQSHGVDSVQSFIAIEDDDLRNTILGFDETDPRMLEIAEFVNKFPSIDISVTQPEEIHAGEFATIHVEIERDIDEDSDTRVVSRIKTLNKLEQWYIVVGNVSSREIYGFTKSPVANEEQTVPVQISIPTAGQYDLKVWCVCDSYLDADKEATLSLTVL